MNGVERGRGSGKHLFPRGGRQDKVRRKTEGFRGRIAPVAFRNNIENLLLFAHFHIVLHYNSRFFI